MKYKLTYEYPAIEKSLKEVVCKHRVLEVIGLSVGHEQRPQDSDDEEVGQAEDDGGQGGGHQHPVRHPRVETN